MNLRTTQHYDLIALMLTFKKPRIIKADVALWIASKVGDFVRYARIKVDSMRNAFFVIQIEERQRAVLDFTATHDAPIPLGDTLK